MPKPKVAKIDYALATANMAQPDCILEEIEVSKPSQSRPGSRYKRNKSQKELISDLAEKVEKKFEFKDSIIRNLSSINRNTIIGKKFSRYDSLSRKKASTVISANKRPRTSHTKITFPVPFSKSYISGEANKRSKMKQPVDILVGNDLESFFDKNVRFLVKKRR